MHFVYSCLQISLEWVKNLIMLCFLIYSMWFFIYEKRTLQCPSGGDEWLIYRYSLPFRQTFWFLLSICDQHVWELCSLLTANLSCILTNRCCCRCCVSCNEYRHFHNSKTACLSSIVQQICSLLIILSYILLIDCCIY